MSVPSHILFISVIIPYSAQPAELSVGSVEVELGSQPLLTIVSHSVFIKSIPLFSTNVP